MPYAPVHYPFSMSLEEFEKRFPADFIGEGLDQTRSWFYTLNVIPTILFKKNPYKNLIANGLVLSETGSKLSKKDKNYDDPKVLFSKYGADAIRLYLINSPLVKAQNLKFSNTGVELIRKNIFLPLYNSYKFLMLNIQRFELSVSKGFSYDFEVISIFINKIINSLFKIILINLI